MNATICPRCFTPTVTHAGAEPWCPRCEWNLDAYEPARRDGDFGWRWLDRRVHRLAYRLAQQQFAALVRGGLTGGGGLARTVMVTASVVLLVFLVAVIVTGGWLVWYDFPSFTIVPGVALLGVAWVIRPRLGRLSDADLTVLDRDDAPELFALVDEVAAAVGTRPPDVIGVDGEVNAFSAQVGLRRRRVLCVGLPLWAVLEPQERVALLGHELGHFVNGDVRRSLLAQPARTMLAHAADVLRPGEPSAGGTFLTLLGELFARIFLTTASNVVLAGHFLLAWVCHHDGQRAEYQADEIGARLAGTTAAITADEVLAASESVHMLVRRDARAGHGPETWRASVAESGIRGSARTAARLQLTLRDRASIFATHPPAGLRVRMYRERPYRDPSLVLTETRSEKIDAELAALQSQFRRDAVHA